MTAYIRDDGIRFVMQPHRESVAMINKSHFLDEINRLSHQHGSFIRFVKLPKKRQYEVVLSNESGYLLGENVWQHFEKPENLIYCEAIPDSADVFLVVVHNGLVKIDKRILCADLQAELLRFSTGDAKYKIVTSGSVPLKKTQAFGAFRFPKELVESFAELDEPVITSLNPLKMYSLSPVNALLWTSRLSLKKYLPVIIVSVFFTALLGWWLLPSSSQKAQTSRQQIASHANYSEFYHSLETPAPKAHLLELQVVISQVNLLSGWDLRHLSISDGMLIAMLSDVGGERSDLIAYAQENGFHFTERHESARLSQSLSLMPRQLPKYIYELSSVNNRLMHRIGEILPPSAIKILHVSPNGSAKSALVVIRLDGESPIILSVIGEALSGLPVSFVSADFQMKKNSIHGEFKLLVWGH